MDSNHLGRIRREECLGVCLFALVKCKQNDVRSRLSQRGSGAALANGVAPRPALCCTAASVRIPNTATLFSLLVVETYIVRAGAKKKRR